MKYEVCFIHTCSNDNAMGIISEHYQRESLFKTIQEKGWSIYQCYIDLHPKPATNGQSLQKRLKMPNKRNLMPF
jgi:hypothetical protein